jgi:hypothetical protein
MLIIYFLKLDYNRTLKIQNFKKCQSLDNFNLKTIATIKRQ